MFTDDVLGGNLEANLFITWEYRLVPICIWCKQRAISLEFLKSS